MIRTRPAATRLAVVLCLVVAATTLGCTKTKDPWRKSPTTQPTEILDNPQILRDATVPFEQLTLRGIKLGDPKSLIRQGDILDQWGDGWMLVTDRCVFRAKDGQIVVLSLKNGTVIDQLGMGTPNDIPRVFGKPETIIEVTAALTIYEYRSGRLRVVWDKFPNRVTAIQVAAEPTTE